MNNPISLFKEWFSEASESSCPEPGAMTLSTVSAEGIPSSRVVLLKDSGEDGFVFYTNLGSRKNLEIEKNPNVALGFYWPEISRQVRITGKAIAVTPEEADAYFESRPRQSQLGAWASKQSTIIENKLA